MDEDKFLFLYQNEFGNLSQSQMAGLLFLMDSLTADPDITDPRHWAYMLATVKHECADRWQPIEEFGKGKGRTYGKVDPATGQVYYGRGYVQLTWADNYKAMGSALGIDLYRHPELALDRANAYKIMSRGMRKGTFTGKALCHYLHDDATDFVNARRIINGTDCAEKIAGYAEKLLGFLQESEVQPVT